MFPPVVVIVVGPLILQVCAFSLALVNINKVKIITPAILLKENKKGFPWLAPLFETSSSLQFFK
jgi:hypothetical protein